MISDGLFLEIMRQPSPGTSTTTILETIPQAAFHERRLFRKESGREDSNLRLLGPKPSALPG